MAVPRAFVAWFSTLASSVLLSQRAWRRVLIVFAGFPFVVIFALFLVNIGQQSSS
jgi:hypothetical protein